MPSGRGLYFKLENPFDKATNAIQGASRSYASMSKKGGSTSTTETPKTATGALSSMAGTAMIGQSLGSKVPVEEGQSAGDALKSAFHMGGEEAVGAGVTDTALTEQVGQQIASNTVAGQEGALGIENALEANMLTAEGAGLSGEVATGVTADALATGATEAAAGTAAAATGGGAAASGAASGASLGPWGAAIGAAIGLAAYYLG